MKLLKNAYFQLAAFASMPFLGMAAYAAFSAPAAPAAVERFGWYNPAAWLGANSALDQIEAANAAAASSMVTWLVTGLLVGAAVAVLARVTELKRVRDPRIVDAAMTAVETFAAKYDMLPEEQEQILAKQQKPAAKTSNRPLTSSAVTA